MSFLRYVSDRLSFVMFYAAAMLLFSSLLYVSSPPREGATNVAYANAGGLALAAIYLYAGYRSRRERYRRLERPVEDPDEWIASLPEARTHEERLVQDRLKELSRAHARRMYRMQDELDDHRDYILSWIHEVKLPIAAGRLLLEDADGKDAEELADKLEDELDRIDHAVEQALYYSRIDAFSRDYLITDVDVVGIVKESVKKHAKLFIAKRIKLKLPDSTLSVKSDPKWLAYIVDQLVSNSLKYTEDEGEIAFSFEEDVSERRLAVTDDGIGIPPEDLGRVFDKGFTGSAGRSRRKSTGIGLYLAQRMALKLGHELSARSEEGVSTRFAVHFPKFRNYTAFGG